MERRGGRGRIDHRRLAQRDDESIPDLGRPRGVAERNGLGEGMKQRSALDVPVAGRRPGDRVEIERGARYLCARTEHECMGAGSVDALMERGNPARHQLDLHPVDGPNVPSRNWSYSLPGR